MKYFIPLLLIVFGIIMYGQRDNKICLISEEKEQLNIINSIVDLELNIHSFDYSEAQLSITEIRKYIVYNSKCASTFVKIKLDQIQELIEEMENSFKPQNKEHLRYILHSVKAKVLDIELEHNENYNLYIDYLWAFEEDMSYATNTAMDQMLDLYDWNEFASMVDCMNEAWALLQNHNYPASLTFNDDRRKKSESTKKIELYDALVAFNRGVNSDDYSNYNLCDLGENLQNSYYEYIKVFSTSFNVDEYYFTRL